MTRRIFAGLIAGASTALASTRDVIQHKILRRPYRQEFGPFGGVERRLFSHIGFTLTPTAPVRVSVYMEGQPEPLSMFTTGTFTGQRTGSINSVEGLVAVVRLRVVMESRVPFTVEGIRPVYTMPPFRRENGEIIFQDPRFGTEPETMGLGCSGDAPAGTISIADPMDTVNHA